MREVINQIILLIKHNNNYDQAAQVCKQHGLNMQQITSMTFKLNDMELARLADAIKRNK